MDICFKFGCVSISVSDYLLTYKRLFPILDLPKIELLSNFLYLACQKGVLSAPSEASEIQLVEKSSWKVVRP